MGKVRTTGVMVGFLLENGKIITCMDTVFTPGQMDENILVHGKMGSNMGKVFIFSQITKGELGSG